MEHEEYMTLNGVKEELKSIAKDAITQEAFAAKVKERFPSMAVAICYSHTGNWTQFMGMVMSSFHGRFRFSGFSVN
jgi:hypothetical protein